MTLNNVKLKLNASVKELGLSTKELGEISKFKIKTINDFMHLDLTKIPTLYGRRVHYHKRLDNKQKALLSIFQGRIPQKREVFTELDPFKIPFKLEQITPRDSAKKSILNRSLIDLLVLDDSHISSIWLHSNDLLNKYFHFSDAIWSKLNQVFIYRDDPISSLITRNLKSILLCFETNDDLFSLFSYFQHYCSCVIDNASYSLCYREQDNSPIVENSIPAPIRNLQLRLFLIPNSILKTLESFDCHCINDFSGISESDIIEKYGLCKKSFMLIGAILEISNYLKSIEEFFAIINSFPLPSKNNSLYSYLIEVISCSDRMISSRNIEISLSYLLSIDQGKLQDDDLVYKKVALEDLANSYNVTRESIRQIVKKVTNEILSKHSRKYLIGLWIEIYNIMIRYKGICLLIRLSEEIQYNFGWQIVGGITFWEKLIKSNPCIGYDSESDCLYIKSWECISCQKIKMKFTDILDNKNSKGINNPINDELELFCKNNCESSSSFATPNYKMLCRYYHYDIDGKVVFDMSKIYRYSDLRNNERNDFSTVIDMIELL
jgi:hypothetical protein